MNLQCIICMELYTPEDEIVITPCGHLFHKYCLEDWFTHQQNCAQCRAACSSINLIRVYLNSASDNEIHLGRNCNIDKITETLEETKVNLKTVQDDLNTSNSTIMELRTIIVSYEDLYLQNIAIKDLEKQLELANNNFETSEENLKKAKAEIIELELSIDKLRSAPEPSTSSSSTHIATLEKDLQLIKLQKEMVDNELKKAKDEIAQMKSISQALALQNLSIYNNVPNPRQQRPNNEKPDSRNKVYPTEHRGENKPENLGQNSSIQNQQHYKSRQRNRIRNKNIRTNDRKPQNDNTKPKKLENEPTKSDLHNMDAPWW